MFNFDFYNPTHIIFGKDRLDTLDQHVPAEAKVLITYGGGSAKKSGLIDKIKTVIGIRTVLEFGGIEPNPRYETLVKAVEIVKTEGVDFLLAVGGGSVIDGTKFIAAASKFDGDYLQILKGGYAPLPVDITVPFGTVLTLPATGSEMNPTAVIINIVKKVLFSNDILCRYGGEEFVVICCNTPAEGVGTAAEKIRKTVEEYEFNYQDTQPNGNLTVSVGAAYFVPPCFKKNDLIQKADQNLYLAKNAGKNKVVLWEPENVKLFPDQVEPEGYVLNQKE